ncbi:hypothetical protein J6590_009811 [Homalodisca vitripennis]|nr:hypothetical protein J6590_009811 [Homalodisca vitripennis]
MKPCDQINSQNSNEKGANWTIGTVAGHRALHARVAIWDQFWPRELNLSSVRQLANNDS